MFPERKKNPYTPVHFGRLNENAGSGSAQRTASRKTPITPEAKLSSTSMIAVFFLYVLFSYSDPFALRDSDLLVLQQFFCHCSIQFDFVLFKQ